MATGQNENQYDISLKAALGAIPGLVFLKDAETGKILFCNDAYIRFAGKETEDEVLGKTDFDLFDPESAAKYVADDKLALSMDEPKIVLDENITDKDGKPVRLKTTKKKYVDPSGRVCLLGVSDDITKITEGIVETKEEADEIKRLNEDLDTFNRLNHANSLIINYRPDAKSVHDVESFECSDDLKTAIGYDPKKTKMSEVEFWVSILHPEDRKAVQEAYAEYFAKGPAGGSEPDTIEIDYRAKIADKGYRWFKNVSVLEKDEKTGRLRMLGIIQDINDTKEMELRQEIVEAIGESTSGLYYVNTVSDRFRIFKKPDYISDKLVNVELPYTRAMGQWIRTGVHEEDQKKMLEMTSLEYIREKLKSSNIFSTTYRSKSTADPHWFEMRISRPIEAEDVNNVTISFFDCNEAVLAELEKEELAKQLEEQNNELVRFKLIAEFFLSTFVSAYYVDLRDGSCITLRRTGDLEERYPIESDYMASVREYISKDVHPDDRAVMYKAVDPNYIREQLKEKNEFSILMRDISGEREKTYRFQAIRGEDEDHCAFGFVDITDTLRKEKEQKDALEKALSDAEQANQAKTSFLFNMSHDVRTPMNAITGYTAMAKKYIDDPSKIRDYLDKIEISGNQLLSLINQVLEMSRIESGKVTLAQEKANVVEKSKEMATISAADAGAKNLKFNLEIGDIQHENVITDVSRMNQVIINVIGNAVKYTPEGGNVTYRVEEEASDKEGMANYVFTIVDDGIGMSKEFLDHIFDEFSRENSSTVSHIQGTGLGMAIVKKIVDLMGGTIRVTSEKDKGTTVRITVPMKIDNDVKIGENKENISEISIEGMKILLAEDNEMNREIAKEILKDNGVIVEEVCDGDEAVSRLTEKGSGYYDLILMDIQMPKMNGYEATKQIRALPDKKLADIPIIAMTANAFEEDRKAAFDAGMNEHLAKPINIQTMKHILARFKSK